LRRGCSFKKDIEDCFAFFEEYLNVMNGKNTPESIIMKKALIKSLVITYGKCFAEAKARKIQLGKEIFTQKNKKVHDEMIRMRNEYIAHAGSSSNEHCKFVMLLPPEKMVARSLTSSSLIAT
jgi:hypothetical protein